MNKPTPAFKPLIWLTNHKSLTFAGVFVFFGLLFFSGVVPIPGFGVHQAYAVEERPLNALLGTNNFGNVWANTYNMGTKFTVNANGYIDKLWANTGTGTVTFYLYNATTQALLATTTASGAGLGTWTSASISPVSVTSGTTYIVSAFNTGYLSYYNSTSPYTTGNITINNGVYGVGAGAFPANSGGGSYYGLADVSYNIGSPPSSYGTTSTQTGNFNVGTTWGGSCTVSCVAGTDYPGTTESVTIAAGHTVTLTGTQTVVSVTMNSTGTLSLGSNTLILTGTGAPLGGLGTLSAGTGTVRYTGAGTTTVRDGTTFYNLELKPGANSVTYNIPADMGPINGNLILGNGTNTGTIVTAQGQDVLIDVAGDVTNNVGNTFRNTEVNDMNVGGSWTNLGTFTAYAGVIFDSGSTGKTITSGGSPFLNLTFNNASGGWTLQDNITTTNLAVTAGTLNASSRTVTITGSSTPFTKTGTVNFDTSTFTYASTTGATLLSGVTYYNLTIAPASGTTPTFYLNSYTSLNGDLTINGVSGTVFNASGMTANWFALDGANGSVTIAANNTLIAPGGTATFYINGSFTNNGTFTHSSGTIEWRGGTQANISGNTTFYNFRANTAGKAIRFAAGSTITINGLLTLTGGSGNNITLNSSTGSSSWTINHQGTENITYTTVTWGACHASSTAITMSGTGNTDGGNNGTCWQSFPAIYGTTSTQTGFFNIGTTWGGSCTVSCVAGTDYPSTSQSVIIATGHTVTLQTTQTVAGATINSGGTLSLGSNTLIIGGTGTPFVVTGTFTPGTGTIQYTGATATPAATTYYNLTAGGTGTYTLGGTTTVSNSATITTGATLALSSFTLVLSGTGTPLTATGTLSAGTGTVQYAGATANVTAATYYNLTFNGAGGGAEERPSNSVCAYDAAIVGWTFAGGYKFTPNANGYIDKFWYKGGSGTVTVYLYRVSDQALLSSASFAAAGVSTWASTSITPVSVTSGAAYKVVVYSTTGIGYNCSGVVTFPGTYGSLTFNTATYGTAGSYPTDSPDGVIFGEVDISYHTGSPGGTFTLAGTTTVTNTATISAGNTLALNSQTLVLSGTGTPLVATGTLSTANGTVQYTGATATVTATTFKNLTLGGTGTYTLPGTAWTIDGNLTVTTGATVTKGAGTITFGNTAGTFTVTGNATNSDLGTISIGNSSAAKVINLGSSITFTAVTITTGATLSLNGANTLTLTGTGTPLTATGTFTASTGTVQYTGATATIAPTTFYNLTIGAGGAITGTLSGTTTVSNIATISTSGVLSLSSYTLILSGTGTPLVATGTFTASTGTVQYTHGTSATVTATTFKNLTLGGTGTYTLPGTSWTIDGNLVVTSGATVTKGAGTISLGNTAGTFTVTGNATNSDLGTISIGNSSAAKVINLGSSIKFTAVTITAGATLSLNGANTMTLTGNSTPLTATGTFTASTGTVNYSSASTTGTTVAAATYYNLTVNTASNTFTAGGTITAKDLTITAGTFVAPASMTIQGNFSNSGTFTHNSGTITFDTVGNTSTITGSNTFYNFTVTTAGKAVRFTAGTTTTINGLLTLTGSAGNNVTLNSNTGSSTWTINHQGTESITYTTVTYGACHASSTSILMSGTGNTNGGNNGTCWSFQLYNTTSSQTGNWSVGTTWGAACASACTVGVDYPAITDSVTIAAGHTVTLAANQTAAGVTINSTGVLSLGSNTLTLSGASPFTVTGTFTPGTGTIEYSNAGATVTNTTYAGLKISGTVTGSTTATVGGALTVTGTLTPSAGTITLNNGSSISNSGTLTFYNATTASSATVTGSSSFSVASGGTFTVGTSSTFTPAAANVITGTGATLTGSGTVKVTRTVATADLNTQYAFTTKTLTNLTVDYAGVSQTISNLTYGGLKVSGSVTAATTAIVGGALTVTGTLTPSSGTITMNNGSSISNSGTLTFYNLTIASGATVTGNTSYSVAVNGTLTNSSTGTFTSNSGTVTMNNGSSIVNSGTTLTFSGLTIASGATVTANTSFSVAGTLTNSSTGTLSPSFGTITMNDGSSIVNSGTTLSFQSLTISGTVTANTSYTVKGTLSVPVFSDLNPISGTVTMENGSTISDTDGSLVFNNLTIATAATVTANVSYGVTGALTVNSGGVLTPSSGTVTLNNGASISNSGTLTFYDLLNNYSSTATGNTSYSVAGTLTNAVGSTFTSNSGTVTMNNGSSIGNYGTQLTFNNLTIANSATVTANTSYTVAGTLTVGTLATLAPSSGTITLSGTGTPLSVTSPDAWCNISSTACNSSWLARRKITLDNSTLSSSLTSFPVLVSLTSSNIDYSKTQGSGQDIRFVDADGVTALSYEIEKWDEAGTSLVWVKVPTVTNNATDYIYMYYNNSGVADGQAATSVWDSSYKGVWHMGDNAANTTVTDSTGANNGTNVANTNTKTTTGKIDGSLSFNGTTDKITVTDSATLKGMSALTLSVWVNKNTKDIKPVGYWLGGSNHYILRETSGILQFYTTTSGQVGGSFTGGGSTGWHLYTATYDGFTMRLYKDGVVDPTTYSQTGSITNGASNNLIIGAEYDGTANQDGSIDETRISNSARTADWIKAEYNTSNNTMNTFAGEEIYGASASPFVPSGTNTVQYTNGTGATVTATTFQNLTLGGAGTYTMPETTLTLKGNLVVTSGANVTKGAGTIQFTGTASQTITGNAINSDLGALQVSSTFDAWCNISSTACNSSWLARRKVTFDNSASTTNLASFPVLVSLTSSNIDYSKTQGSGQDIRFVDADGVTALSYEIEKWDEAGTSLVWVKVPTVTNNATDYIYMYYNNSGVADGQAATSVWDTNYKGVYHLPDGSSLSAIDSIGINNGSLVNTPTATTGQIGGAASIVSASSQYINLGSGSTLNITGAITLDAWVKFTTLSGTYQTLSSNYDAAGGVTQYTVQTNPSNGVNFTVDGITGYKIWSTPNSSVTTGTWYHIVATHDGTLANGGVAIYINGIAQSLTITPSGTPDMPSSGYGNTTFGRSGSFNGNYLNGVLDESRISNSARTADWIKAEYNTSNNTMNTFGSEESSTAIGVLLGSSITATSVTIDSGKTFSVNGSNTLELTGTGTPLTVSGTFTPSTGTVSYSGATANLNAMTYNSLTLGSGTYTAPAGTITLTGDFTNNGTFTHNSGTVVLAPIASSKITQMLGTSNTTTFYNVTNATAGATVKFKNGITYVFANNLTVTGTNEEPIWLTSDSVGNQFTVTFNSTGSLSYVGVRDGACSGGVNLEKNNKLLFNGGNNDSCWGFIVHRPITYPPGEGPGSTSSSGGGGGQGSGTVQATATANRTNGVISTVTVNIGGSGYTTTPSVCFQDSGGGSGGTATSSISNGAVISITVTASGGSYTASVTVGISAPPGDGGSGCSSGGGGGPGGGGGGAP